MMGWCDTFGDCLKYSGGGPSHIYPLVNMHVLFLYTQIPAPYFFFEIYVFLMIDDKPRSYSRMDSSMCCVCLCSYIVATPFSAVVEEVLAFANF